MVVLLASFALIPVIVIASCGGVIRLPWYMGGLEFSGQRPQERITAESQVLFVTKKVRCRFCVLLHCNVVVLGHF